MAGDARRRAYLGSENEEELTTKGHVLFVKVERRCMKLFGAGCGFPRPYPAQVLLLISAVFLATARFSIMYVV